MQMNVTDMFKENINICPYINNYFKIKVKIMLEETRKNGYATKFNASLHFFSFHQKKASKNRWQYCLRHLERFFGS